MLVVLALCSAALAQVIDATLPVVLSSAEVEALGGVGTPFAYGARGQLAQPASAAIRRWEDDSRFSPGFYFGTESFGQREPIDLANTGHAERGWTGGALGIGISAALGPFGAGVAGNRLRYSRDNRTVESTTVHGTFAYALSKTGLAVGIGDRVLLLRVIDEQGRQHEFAGHAPEAGLLLSSPGKAWSAAVAVRAPVNANDAGGDLVLPATSAALPWQVAIGGGYAAHVRPGPSPRRAWRLLTELVLDGPVTDGLAMEPLLDEQSIIKGRTLTLSPRLGGELELAPDRLKLRAGSYLEPRRLSRSDCPSTTMGSMTCAARLHGTGGFALRLFHVRLLKGLIDTDLAWAASMDHAPRYANVSWLALGSWQSGLVAPGTDSIKGSAPRLR